MSAIFTVLHVFIKILYFVFLYCTYQQNKFNSILVYSLFSFFGKPEYVHSISKRQSSLSDDDSSSSTSIITYVILGVVLLVKVIVIVVAIIKCRTTFKRKQKVRITKAA